jgi:hypothetical protein
MISVMSTQTRKQLKTALLDKPAVAVRLEVCFVREVKVHPK